MQECAAKWRNMSIEEKAPYQKLADVDKERWQTEKAAEKKPKDQYRPKRPPSAYFLFLRDFREQWKNEHEGELKAEGEAKAVVALRSGWASLCCWQSDCLGCCVVVGLFCSMATHLQETSVML